MKKGDYVSTPRFLRVQVQEVYKSRSAMWDEGYREPTHYKDSIYEIYGKHVGKNMMQFAALEL